MITVAANAIYVITAAASRNLPCDMSSPFGCWLVVDDDLTKGSTHILGDARLVAFFLRGDRERELLGK